ncbi:hypothetical protein [Parathalassolituus penaei]|uniref:Uncharacterized protein n=1 Tax=Parathalassolituus penaei TaxID=2997323 RepID=A0A9X3EG65_9GAMM|nr:hypothetical protein [Parathalassolituus penaei]MCY0966124.1 hypothetical protein [Parathalassolituus penaei]
MLSGPEALVRAIVVRDDSLLLALSGLDQSLSYKIIASRVDGGFQPGLWWIDDFVYDPGQLNLVFSSRGQSAGSGHQQTFTGLTTVNKSPVSRTVMAIAIDGDEPVFLAQTQSSETTGQYTLQWQGYTGQILVTALDDYGVPHVAGATHGVGERVHPATPNGFVYQISVAGQLGMEPVWPTSAGALVMSGSCQLVAVPFYRPKTVGPVVV